MSKSRYRLKPAARPEWVLAAICLAGCASTPARLPEDTGVRSGHAMLIRGFRDWYSAGIDQLASRLRDAGVAAAAYPDAGWDRLVEPLDRAAGPVVLIGFSYGADDVISLARHAHRPFDLLVTIDPVTPATVPANVRRCVNFYQPNGIQDALPFLRGVPVHGAATTIANVNVRERQEFVRPDTSHATIAANPAVQAAILNLVLQTCPLRATDRR